MTHIGLSVRSIYRLRSNPIVKEYVERCADSYVDKLLTFKAKTNKILFNAAEAAANKIAQLSLNASNEETQRKAANDVLTLAGLRAPEQVEHSVMPHLQVVFDEAEDSEFTEVGGITEARVEGVDISRFTQGDEDKEDDADTEVVD